MPPMYELIHSGGIPWPLHRLGMKMFRCTGTDHPCEKTIDSTHPGKQIRCESDFFRFAGKSWSAPCVWIYIPRWHFPVPTPFGDYINIKGPEHGPPPPAVEPTQAHGVQHNIVRAPVRLTGGVIYTDPLTLAAPASCNSRC